MAYTQEFIDRVKQLYPESARMHELAEEGSYFLGRWLDDSSSRGFSAYDVLHNSHEELVEQAKIMQERIQLYNDFVSGKCYSKEDMRIAMCPAMYMQNSNHPNRYELDKQICVHVGYVGCYPDCKKWCIRELCWQTYDELTGGK